MLSVATYAWITLSVSPSVEGMSVNIGANGGLEIALLSDATYRNTDLILTSVGDSSEIRAVEEANLSWGNLLDLSPESYGLRHVKLLPTMLIAHAGKSGTVRVGDGLLRIPAFGADGRITSLEENALSGVYEEGAFLCSTGGEPHGVRAIGTTEETSSQQRAMILARSGISVSQTMARQAAENALREHGSVLFNLAARHALSPEEPFGDEDAAALLELTAAVETALGHLDAALRDSAIAVAASQLSEESQFESVHALLRDERLSLNLALSSLPMSLSETLGRWAGLLEGFSRDISEARTACEALTGGTYTWEELAPIIARFVDLGQVYYGEELYAPEKPLSAGMRLTLMPGNGVFPGIADFTGEYDASALGWEGLPENHELELRARSTEQPPWLSSLNMIAANLEAAGDEALRFPLEDVYGYAIDMAFRTNAAGSSLLLQTEAAQRIYGDATLPDTQGGGSYMALYSSGLEFDRLVRLMDALRVTFVDGSGTLLAMAKLNVSNIEEYNEGYRAPLYLYDYSVANDSVVMGERRPAPGTIVSLPQNTPVIVSAVVWLDGEAVGNSLASSFGSSLTGTLNLQFSEDRELRPAENGDLHDSGWAVAEASDRVLGSISALSELPNASLRYIDLYSNEAEAKDAGEELPEDYYVLVRDGLPCFRIYPMEAVLEYFATGEDTVEDRWITRRIVMTGYDAEGLSLPPDSSGLFAGLEALTAIRHLEKLNVSTAINTDHLFDGCGSLISVNDILPGLTRIGDYAFSWCGGLTEFVLRNGVTSIGDYAFAYCSSLTGVTIPEGVTSIGSGAFDRCSSLSSIEIPAGMTSLGEGALGYMPSLARIIVDKDNPSFAVEDGVLFSADRTKLIRCPGTMTGSFTIPDHVTSIEYGAFSGCSGLESIMLPSTLTSIGSYAFSDCRVLTEINIPEGVTSIGESAFDNCTSLTDITIPEGVTSIGDYAFAYCSSLTGVTIPESLTSIGRYAFIGCSSLTSITIPEGVTSIEYYAFAYCTSLSSISVPAAAQIHPYAFYNCPAEIIRY